VLSVRRRCCVRKTVEVIRIKERCEVCRTVTFVAAEVARDDEIIGVYGRLLYDVVRDISRERCPREDFLKHVERHLFLVTVKQRSVQGHGPHVLTHELVVGRVDVVLGKGVGEESAVQRVQNVKVQIAHVAQRNGGKRHRDRYHLDRHLLREVEKAPQHFGDLNGEYQTGGDTNDGPYTATDGRPRFDDFRNTVERRPIGEFQQNIGSFHDMR